MKYVLSVLLSLCHPEIAFAQDAPASSGPHETPWGGLVAFGALLIGGGIYTWMVWFKKKDKKED